MIQGDIKNMPGVEILQILSQGEHCGCLVVESKMIQRRIYLSNEGVIRYMESEAPKEKLGFLLTQMSLVSVEDLEKLRHKEQVSGTKTASLLLKQELVTPKEMGRCIKYQFQTVLTSILALNIGKFWFQDGVNPPKNTLNIRASLQSMLLNCITQSDEIQHLLTQLGGYETFLSRVNSQRNPVTLSPVELEILILSDQQLTIRDYLEKVAFPDMEILKALVQMVSVGLLSKSGKKEPKEIEYIPSERMAELERVLIELIGPMGEFILEEAMELLSDDGKRIVKADWGRLTDKILLEMEPSDRQLLEGELKRMTP